MKIDHILNSYYDKIRFLHHNIKLVYKFQGFVLNTAKRELLFKNTQVYLTKKCYDLLLFLLKNSNQAVSREQLIEHVWNSRVVTDNTIDQCISKLRKTLNKENPSEYIKSVYGQGIHFIPETTVIYTNSSALPSSKYKKLAVVLIPVLFISIWFFTQQYQSDDTRKTTTNTTINKPTNKLINISITSVRENTSLDTEDNDKWFFDGGIAYLNTMLAQNASVQPIKATKEWQQNKDKQIIAIDLLNQNKVDAVVLNDFGYDGEFYTAMTSFRNKSGIIGSQHFQARKIQQLMVQVSSWTLDKAGIQDETVESLLTKQDLSRDEFALESYIRAMSAQLKGDSKKAIVFLETAVEQDPTFLQAWYELAIAYRKQGNYKKSLAILNSLTNTSVNLAYKIEMVKGHTYDSMKDFEQAQLAYQKSYDFAKDLNRNDKLAAIRVSQAITYINMGNYEKGREALDEALSITNLEENPHFYGVIMNTFAKLEKAKRNFPKAINLAKKGIDAFIKAGDKRYEMQAKSRLSSLLRYQGEFGQAEELAKESLIFATQQNQLRSISSNHFKLGLIYHATGKFALSKEHWLKALELNKSFDLPIEKAALFEYLIDLHLAFYDKENAEIYLQRLEDLYIQSPLTDIKNIFKRAALKYALYAGNRQQAMQLIAEFEGEATSNLLLFKGDLSLLKQNNLAAENNYQASLEMLNNTGDFYYISQVMNRLNHLYLQTNNEKAEKSIYQTAQYKPFAYPYLKYLAQLNFKQGNTIKAITLLQELKLKANDYWQAQDQLLLERYQKTANN